MKWPICKRVLLALIAIGSIVVTTKAVYSQSWFVNKKCIRCDLTRADLEHRNLQNINFRGTKGLPNNKSFHHPCGLYEISTNHFPRLGSPSRVELVSR